MDYKRVETLVDRYFEGETTLEEEAQLRAFYQEQQLLPDTLSQYAPLFRYTAHEQGVVAQKNQSNIQRYRWGIAASVLLLISLSTNYYYNTFLPQQQAQQALYEFKTGMNYLSQNLNKGRQSMQYINYFDVSKKKIFKQN